MTKPIYFPALSAATTNYMKKSDEELAKEEFFKSGKSPRFYNEGDKIFHHPYTLWSAAHHFKIPDLRKECDIKDECLVFIDSGGYQLATGVVNEKSYNNKIALEWSEKNGDLFPILDRPLTPGCSFDEHLELSFEAGKFYDENRTNRDCKILNVMSARNIPEMEKWYGKMSQIELDGWAHGGHKGNIKTIVKGLLFFINQPWIHKQSERIFYHVFGISSVVSMIYFAALQKELNRLEIPIQLTYDSSSFQRSAAFGLYFLATDKGMKSIRFSNTMDYSNLPDDYRLPCDCPVCTDMKSIDKYFSSDSTMHFYLITTLHNLYMMLRSKNLVDNLVYTDVPGFIDGCFDATIRHNLKAIEKAFSNPKHGPEVIEREFKYKEEYTEAANLSEFFGE